MSIFIFVSACGQKNKVSVGAYYFDGWTGTYPYHITPLLKDSFPEREPKWGWITSTPEIMEEQIDLAADAGLSFFNFCWYFPNNSRYSYKDEPLNNALNLYLNSPNKHRLEFCIMVANHEGNLIGAKDWKEVTEAWITLFKDSCYLKVDDKPLITFFGIKSLINSFGSEEAVRSAFESFRNACKAEGLKGVSIALCSHPEEERVTVAQNCGIDILTGYNYHEYGFIPENEITPVDSLTSSSIRIWNKFAKISTLPYIPVATLNWDIRPWKPSDKLRYVGYSSESVYKSIEELQKWVNNNYNNTCKERIAFLYAWNEYGEGAWLTPSPYGKEDFLQGVQRALKNNKKK